jgi:hypothetical protein
MNQKHHDKALDETNGAVSLDFTTDTRIESNYSSKLELPLTSPKN